MYQTRIIDYESGAVGGMRIGRGNSSTQRKPAPVPLCLPSIKLYGFITYGTNFFIIQKFTTVNTINTILH
jgi:hypothetical protein